MDRMPRLWFDRLTMSGGEDITMSEILPDGSPSFAVYLN